MKKRSIPLIATAALAVLAIGTNTFAQEDEDPAEPSEPGVPYVEGDASLTENAVPEDINIVANEFDPTILTKFIPGDAFVAEQRTPGTVNEDALNYQTPGACVSPTADGNAGLIVRARAGVELPDSARIKRVIFHGVDDHAENISVRLDRTNFRFLLLGGPTRTDALVTSFTTAGGTGTISVASADNLNELAGINGLGGIIFGTDHRYHSLEVQMTIAAGNNHALCGIEIQYQVPAGSVEAPTFSSDPGTTFYPVDPFRAYDGRVASYPESGLLAPNTSKTINIKDAHDTAGGLTVADVVPANATAITYNVTIAGPTGPNFVAVTPGDALAFTASAVNFNGTADIANAGTVKIDASRQIKVWGGDQAGSMYVIIDVTGYYAPPPDLTAPVVEFPNMGN